MNFNLKKTENQECQFQLKFLELIINVKITNPELLKNQMSRRRELEREWSKLLCFLV